MLGQRWPLACTFANDQFPHAPRRMAFVLNGEFCDVRRVEHHVDRTADEWQANLVLPVHEADAAGLVDLTRLTMQEGVRKLVRIYELKRLLVAAVGGFWTAVILKR